MRDYSKNKTKYCVDVKKLLENGKQNNDCFLNSLAEILTKFKNVYLINSVTEYVDFINILLKEYYRNKRSGKRIREKYYFRGISSINQSNSKLFRELKNVENEFYYIQKFEENVCGRNLRFDNPIDLISAAQHYGMKTRLKDWSSSPLVATLFSLYLNSDNNDYYGVEIINNRECVIFKTLAEKNSYNTFTKLSIRYMDMIENYNLILEYKKQIPIKIRNIIINTNDNDLLISTNDNILNFSISDVNRDSEIFKYNHQLEKIWMYIKTILCNSEINLDEQKIKKYFRKFLDENSRVFLQTNFSNDRIRIQRGLFELTNKPVHVDDYNYFSNESILLIPHNVRNEIIKYIDRLGFNYYLINSDDIGSCSNIACATVEGDLDYRSQINYGEKGE